MSISTNAGNFCAQDCNTLIDAYESLHLSASNCTPLKIDYHFELSKFFYEFQCRLDDTVAIVVDLKDANLNRDLTMKLVTDFGVGEILQGVGETVTSVLFLDRGRKINGSGFESREFLLNGGRVSVLAEKETLTFGGLLTSEAGTPFDLEYHVFTEEKPEKFCSMSTWYVESLLHNFAYEKGLEFSDQGAEK